MNLKHIFQPGIKFTELTAFIRQFATMCEARLSLLTIFDILYQQTENRTIKIIIDRVKRDAQGGKTLHESFNRYNHIFTPFFLQMLKVGELTGQLDHMLLRVAVYYEKINSLKRKLLQALAYPALVVTVALAAVSFLLAYVVPTFADMFRDFDAQLPAITLILMNISAFISARFWIFPVTLVALVSGTKYLIGTKDGQIIWHKLQLNLPISGAIIKKNYISRFARTLGLLLESGIPILDALKVTSDSIPNTMVKSEINQMRYYAERGNMLTQSLKKSKIFPPMVTQMITVGEETAQLDKMLNRLADYYDSEIEASLSNLTTLLEPVIIIFLGVVLGTILIALYMPLFDLVNIVPQ
jgi:type IV pilus assembly protein PilC